VDFLTLFGASAIALSLLSYALEHRSTWWIFGFAVTSAASSLYGFLAGTWPFGVVEIVWTLVALRRWWHRRTHKAVGAPSS
jgi:hypothetical protein